MSRFDTARKGRIVVWTGAALAWGTAVTVAGLEPSGAAAATPSADGAPSATIQLPASETTLLPTRPESGLVILRYQPSEKSEPEVQTVYVRQKAPAVQAPAPRPTPAPAPPPQPKSSGS